ncbi:MAG: hypothetical protein AB4042_13560 [Leptolyngbyaceae cyanobacterium]
MKSYLKIYLGLSVSAIGVIGFLNWLVDPLWYGDGNRLSSRNFAFNERVSKTNLFIQTQSEENYDCLIFGSSTATLLRPSSFAQHHCFNYAFSAGRVEEFVEYGQYAKEQGIEPDIVYVGIDPFNFSLSLSEFSGMAPIDTQPIHQAYLSWDVFLFSLRTLFEESPYPRYYDSRRDFESDIIESPPRYQPEFTDTAPRNGCQSEKAALYDELRQVFPNATFVGYVPPYSGWYVVNEMYTPGGLDCYIESVYEVANGFDHFYDFAIPSEITTRIDNTYDGSHYYPEVHQSVAEVMQSEVTDFGFDVKGSSISDYRGAYRDGITEFLVREDQDERLASDF